jgi:hypothetical protein
LASMSCTMSAGLCSSISFVKSCPSAEDILQDVRDAAPRLPSRPPTRLARRDRREGRDRRSEGRPRSLPACLPVVNTVGCYGNVWSITFALTIAVDRRRNENASTKVLNETTLTERAPNPCRVTNPAREQGVGYRYDAEDTITLRDPCPADMWFSVRSHSPPFSQALRYLSKGLGGRLPPSTIRNHQLSSC